MKPAMNNAAAMMLTHMQLEERFLESLHGIVEEMRDSLLTRDSDRMAGLVANYDELITRMDGLHQQRQSVQYRLAEMLAVPVDEVRVTLVMESCGEPSRSQIDAARGRLAALGENVHAMLVSNSNLASQRLSLIEGLFRVLCGEPSPGTYGSSGRTRVS